MPRNPFVRPEVRRLDLAEGDWIDVKKYLTAGERANLEGAGLREMTQSESGKPAFVLDYARLRLAKIDAFVVGWSFVDEKGNQQKVTRENIEALDHETSLELEAAIDAHMKAMKEERDRPTIAPVGATS